MNVSIMQPYFFPYIGYISLIENSDLFILLDKVQFIRHGWIERNRILDSNNVWQYIKVSIIKPKQKTLIRDLSINNDINWKDKILAQLNVYKKIAPHFYKIKMIIEKLFENNFLSIVELNKAVLIELCKLLDIHTEIIVFSESDIEIEEPKAPDEWALNICKSIGNVQQYINPIGGKEIFSIRKYEENNIELKFLKHNLPEYPQGNYKFEPALSIIDVLMFNDLESTKEMLKDFSYE